MKPRLAFVSLWNAADPDAFSGYAYSMRRQLQKTFEVVDVFPLALPGERWYLPLRAAYKLTGRYYHPMREPAVLKALGRRIETALREIAPDAVFAPSSLPMSYVETAAPWIYSTDQLFCDFVETYIPRPSARFRRLGDAQEARSLANAARAAYPSAAAAHSAVHRYGANEAKISVIPWGANLPREIPDETAASGIAARRLDTCHLVFIGRDWHRKGGDTLVATVTELQRMGLDTHATIIGCQPPGLPREKFTVHPFLDKKREDHFHLLSTIMQSAHFFFLPSRAEAYGQAFCEAAAFGVPLIGSTSGGIPTIIREGETGFLRPADTPAEQFASLIRDTLAMPDRYRSLAREARRDYLARLNWDRFGAQLTEIIMSAL